jgi:sugar phosphate isomerase/epimerase
VTKPFSQHGVQSSALNAGLSSLFGLNAVSSKSIAQMKISLSQLTTLRWTLSDEVSQLKQTGFDAIGLWRPKLVEFGEHRAAELLQKARLSVSSLSFAGGFTGGCGFTYDEAIADGRHAIDQATIVGAQNVIMVGGPRHGHTARHCRRLVVDGLRHLADFAELSHVKLSVLPMHQFFNKRWTFLHSLDQTLEVLKEIGHPQVGLAFDTYHLWEEPRLLDRISEIAPLTNIVQISDSDHSPRSEQDRRMPGEGVIPLPNLVQAFQMAGFAGYFDVHVWSGNVWKSNYTHLIEQSHAAVKAMSLRTATNV